MASGVLPRANVSNNAATLAYGTTSTIGRIDGTALTVTMPAQLSVVNNLTSSSTTAALSANMGRTLVTPSTASNNGFNFYKVGRLCYVTFSTGTVGTNYPVGSTICSIPSGYTPIQVCIALGYGSGGTVYYFHINAGGTIGVQVRDIPSGSWFRMSACYITYS